MLAAIAASLAFTGRGAVLTSTRAPAASMAAPSPLGNDLVYQPGAKLGETFGKAVDFGVTAPPLSKAKPVKPFEKFCYEIVDDSTKGPPCGVCHHQGSGTPS